MKCAPWPKPPDLGPDEVHLWWGRIDGAGSPAQSPPEPAHAWLSQEEHARAARFHFERDRRRFLARRVFLRGLLAGYLDLDPVTLGFEDGLHGKPRLASTDQRPLSFNLSHSQGWVLIGVARGRELGVDVEAQKLRTELGSMAKQVFTPSELATLEAVEEDARLTTFFRGWTRKEAALKATGEGFAREPRTLEVGLQPSSTEDPWRAVNEPVLCDYSLADLQAPEGFSAAVCARGNSWSGAVVADWRQPLELRE